MEIELILLRELIVLREMDKMVIKEKFIISRIWVIEENEELIKKNISEIINENQDLQIELIKLDFLK